MVPTAQLESFGEIYPDAEVIDLEDGSLLVTVPMSLPPGWSSASTTVRFVVPTAYPASPPDCFYADEGLRLASGVMPANSGHQVFRGNQYLWFSWHVSDWHPNRNDIASFVRFIGRRFKNAN